MCRDALQADSGSRGGLASALAALSIVLQEIKSNTYSNVSDSQASRPAVLNTLKVTDPSENLIKLRPFSSEKCTFARN